MKIAILSSKPKLYSTARLIAAAEGKGHEIEIINTRRCYMSIASKKNAICGITSKKSAIHYRGEELNFYDAVIPRIGNSITFYGAAVVRQFEMMGVYSVNGSTGIVNARDKLRALQLLAQEERLGLPITGFAHAPDDIGDLIKMVGGTPLVIKLVEGTQGIGVVLAETQTAAESVIEAFLGMKANILVQEYVKEANGADIRCFVIGDKVVAAMLRQAKPGGFRSNLHRGGKAHEVELTSQERNAAILAAQTVGLQVAGVDLLRSERGPLVMEVNASPGLEGIERATQVDVASLIIEFIEAEAKKKNVSK